MEDLREEIVAALEGKEKCQICGKRTKKLSKHLMFNKKIYNVEGIIKICPHCHRLPIKDLEKMKGG